MIYLEEITGKLDLKIKRLYIKSFPRVERKPFFMLYETRDAGHGELLVAHDSDTNKAVGIAFMMTDGERMLLDYLAVMPELRSKGYGGQILSALRERYKGKTIILEIETADEKAKNNAERIRRKAFYLRNGLTESGIIINLFSVEMELLYYGDNLTFGEYYSLLEKVFGENKKKMIEKNVSFVRQR